ncbi:response regulator [Halobacillus litoralis]|uniref:response regulator n=1 Tax=Halobacillus litoralis TaxID=45668 RepID=UPI001CFDEE87|nr:response regulator [Halobacillus litoralis]
MTNRILIVDDQPGIRLLLEEILKMEGCETICAKTGREACDLVEELSPDLIIMDYNLPVMHGKDVLLYLENIDFHSPVIIITGESKESIQQEVDFPFVTDIITKPFDIQNLKDLVVGTLVHSSS